MGPSPHGCQAQATLLQQKRREGTLEANWELGMESVIHKLSAECLWFGKGLEGDLAAAALSGKVVTTSPTKVVRRWQWPLPGG